MDTPSCRRPAGLEEFAQDSLATACSESECFVVVTRRGMMPYVSPLAAALQDGTFKCAPKDGDPITL